MQYIIYVHDENYVTTKYLQVYLSSASLFLWMEF
jgi:hypothetical protein